MTFLSPIHIDDLGSSSMLQASGTAMRRYGNKRALSGTVDRQGWRQFLKTRHPQKTAHEIAARTGISADTVEKWFRGASPSFEATVILLMVYGPEFLSTCAPDCRWAATAAREARRAALDDVITAAEAERERLLGLG